MAEDASMQADTVLKEPRVLHLNPRQHKINHVHTGWSLSTGDLKAHTHSDTLPPTNPYFQVSGLISTYQ